MHSAGTHKLEGAVSRYFATHALPKLQRECCVCRRTHKRLYCYCEDDLGIFVIDFFDAALSGIEKFGAAPICGHCSTSLANALFYRFHYSIPREDRHDPSPAQKVDMEYLIVDWLSEKLKKAAVKSSRESDNSNA